MRSDRGPLLLVFCLTKGEVLGELVGVVFFGLNEPVRFTGTAPCLDMRCSLGEFVGVFCGLGVPAVLLDDKGVPPGVTLGLGGALRLKFGVEKQLEELEL